MKINVINFVYNNHSVTITEDTKQSVYKYEWVIDFVHNDPTSWTSIGGAVDAAISATNSIDLHKKGF